NESSKNQTTETKRKRKLGQETMMAFRAPANKLARSDNLVDALFSGFAQPLTRMHSQDMPLSKGLAMNLTETKDALVCTVDTPGVNKEEIHVTCEDGVLTIAADHKEEKSGGDEDAHTHWQERFVGHASRSIKLPDYVDTDKIAAKQENGVLTLTIPKKAEETPKSKKIAIA
ncbi:Heat shock protein 16 (16 kDa heat shock protein), partial [Durusdinium trenchii]